MEAPHSEALLTLCLSVGGGLVLTVISRRIKLPTIVALLAGGVILGPEVLRLVVPESLGDLLPTLVSLAIGLILFEGGLTLNLRDYLESPTVIKRLLSVGAVVTWLVSAAVVWLIFGLSLEASLLAGSMVIVTGPTVIVPLLKRIQASTRLSSILHWEGVMIDAVGVFIAIMCFELFVAQEGASAILNFLLRFGIGIIIGGAGGWLIHQLVERRWIPDDMINSFALASAIIIFGLAESFLSEAGLLAVTLAGLTIGWKNTVYLREIRNFKAEITDLLIGALFILLVARLDLQRFTDSGWQLALAVGLIILLARPLNILVSTYGTDLNLREKAFLSWVAPRGVVAASLASLFALALEAKGDSAHIGTLLETFTYAVICGTVVIQGFSAGMVAKWLGVKRPEPTGWLIVGAHELARRIAASLRDQAEVEVVFIDNNARFVNLAIQDGFRAIRGDAREADLLIEQESLGSIGNLLALTDNPGLNQLLATRWQPHIKRENIHIWAPGDEPTTSHENRVFSTLPRPSVINQELRSGAASLQLYTIERPKTGNALLTFNKTKKPVLLQNSNQLTDSDHEDRPVLWLQRAGGYLHRSLSNGLLLELEVNDLTQLYAEMMENAKKRHPMLSTDALMDDLTAQEKIYPPFIGHGIAVPHAYSDTIDERICILARLRPPLAVKGLEESLDLVFLVISPAGDPEGHLATLGEIARFCHDASQRQALLQAKQTEDLPWQAFES